MSIFNSQINQSSFKYKTSKIGDNIILNNTYNPNNYNSQKNPNPIENQFYSTTPSPIIFKERNGKLKWKEILRVDIETMIKTSDISPLESLLENLIFSNIEENDIQVVPDNSIIKLVKLYQYVLEYLLFIQQKVDSENKIYESNYKTLINDSTIKESLLKENKNIINLLKKDNKQKEQLINTYKYMLDEYKKGEFNEMRSEGEIIYCKICENKKFGTQDALRSHYRRRHPNEQINEFDMTASNNNFQQNNLNPQNTYRETQKVEENIKNYLDTIIKNNSKNDNFSKLLEQQKNLEMNITEIKNDNGKIKEIEKTVNKMMKKINKIKDQTKSEKDFGGMSIPINESRIKEDSILQHTEKLNQQITDVYRHNSEKIDKINENLEDFKKVILSQIDEISRKSLRPSNIIKEKIVYNEDTRRTERKDLVVQSQSVEKFEISNSQNFQNSTKKDFNERRPDSPPLIVPQKKRFFNASSKIESDNSDEEKILAVSMYVNQPTDLKSNNKKEITDNQITKTILRESIKEQAPIPVLEKSNKSLDEKIDNEKSRKFEVEITTSIKKTPEKKEVIEVVDKKKDDEINSLSYSPDSVEKFISQKKEEIRENKIKRGEIEKSTKTEKKEIVIEENKGKGEKKFKNDKIKSEIKEEIKIEPIEEEEVQKKPETIEQITSDINEFYNEFQARDIKFYDEKNIEKLKFDKYYQCKDLNNDLKEDLDKFIKSNLSESIANINKNLKINFDDLSKVQTEQLVTFIKEIQTETLEKCNNNPYYKMYYERLIKELNLQEYFKTESNIKKLDKSNLSKSSLKEESNSRFKSNGPQEKSNSKLVQIKADPVDEFEGITLKKKNKLAALDDEFDH